MGNGEKFYYQKIIRLLIFIFILFLNYSVMANTIKENDNLSDNITELEAKSLNNNYEEEKIIKYDATTGKSTVVDINELRQKKNVSNALNSILTNYTPAYNPSPSLFLDKDNKSSWSKYNANCSSYNL